MKESTPRLRMFAGPNGSGKSTLKTVLPEKLLGIYLNPDEIEKSIFETGYLDFSDYNIFVKSEDVLAIVENSGLLNSEIKEALLNKIRISDNQLFIPQQLLDSYLASTLTEFIRFQLVTAGVSFTFETVMSHESKVEFLTTAQKAGFRTYLYYVATDDPEINISRVRYRVSVGGHNVPMTRLSVAITSHSNYCTTPFDVVIELISLTIQAALVRKNGLGWQRL